jgi:predicted transcriptional regulator
MPLGNLLIREKQARIILALRDGNQAWSISNLAKAASTTYVHACNFVIDCERAGIVASEKHGKIKEIKLTEKGLQIADSLSSIYNAVNSAANQPKKPDEKKQ